MQSIALLRQQVEEAIQHQNWGREPVGLYDPIAYTMQVGGKRMRPVLLLLGNEMCGGNPAEAMPAAIGIELFHNFTLLHDDIMDQAPLRRGRKTVYRKYNLNTAILSGDVMFAEACQLVSQVPDAVLRPVLNRFHRTAIEVCEGQQFDLEFEKSDSVSIEAYLKMITRKTAVLLGCSLELGCLIAKGDPELAAHFYDIGLHLGIAFQLQDDILDTYGTSARFGKQVGGDIVQNKKTYLLLKAYERAGEIERNQLNEWINQAQHTSAEKVAGVKQVFDALDIYQLACEERDSHFERAMNDLNHIPVDESRKEPLRHLAETLLDRDH